MNRLLDITFGPMANIQMILISSATMLMESEKQKEPPLHVGRNKD